MGEPDDLQPPANASEPQPAEQAPTTMPSSSLPELSSLSASTTTSIKKKKHSFSRSILEFVLIVAGAAIVAYLLQAFLIKPFQIPSESMEHTLNVGDRVLVNRLAYRFGSPQRGDIVVFKSPRDSNQDLIKRVIAVGGDTIEVKRGKVFVNGESQIEYFAQTDLSNFPAQTVPEGSVFVMGDNRNHSQDSRLWKPPWVPVESIIGKAFMIYWPLDRITWLE